jgi:hypothetical protein
MKTTQAQTATKVALTSALPQKGAANGSAPNGRRVFLLPVFVLSCAAQSLLTGNINAMSTKYEDNFGFYCIDDDDSEELEFFCHIKAHSKPTICARCDQKVRLLEHVKICATCSDALEYGAPSDPAWVAPNLWSAVGRGVRS